MTKVPMFNAHAESYEPRMIRRVDFPKLDHFMEDVRAAGIHHVRIDVFESARNSELSFVYYVSLVLVLTAADAEERVVYQFTEVQETVSATVPHITDELVCRRGMDRKNEVLRALLQAGFEVGHGRFVCEEE